MKILFVSSELSPLAKSGGLGDVVGSLPQAIRAQGHDVRIIMPLYKKIKERYSKELQFLRWSMTKLGWRTMYNGLFTMEVQGVPVYFIDNEFYFGHDALYVEYSFDIERFSFFQRAVLEVLGAEMDFQPDILHLNDWQTGMIPVLLEAHYKSHGYHTNVQVVYTIHNLKYQGIHGKEKVQDLLEIPVHYLSEAAVLKDGVPNFMKAGIMYSNRVTTVSPSYAQEILMDYYGEGLNGILGAQAWKLVGILNGIDVKAYNPDTDPALEQRYSLRNWRKGKGQNKAALQAKLGLSPEPNTPLLALISRLTSQKGIDLLLHIADDLMAEKLQLVILGTGDSKYEEACRQLQLRHPDKIRTIIEFSEDLSRQIYAAADIFLMPSLFEPCGLAQMMAMRYGALPLVRETGGLKDTVVPYDQYAGTGDGFSFSNINAHELLYTCKNACQLYNENQSAWGKLVRTAMTKDFSWEVSAQRYVELYEQILKETVHAP